LDSEPNVISARIRFTYVDSLHTLSHPLIFQAALLETDIESGNQINTSVLRKFLMETAGTTIANRTWKFGEFQEFEISQEIDVPIQTPTKLSIAAFVQDKNTTRRIHQAAIIAAPEKQGTNPVGVDDPVLAELKGLMVYPNPASKIVNLYLDDILHGEYHWQIIDQRGVSVLQGDLNNDLRTPQQIAIGELSNGVYFIKLADETNAVMYRKIVILNRN
ncbi:MAG TPA: T9SS type A sorting domain-containing protein, partial [Chryseosolibacter sp.]|nr:T9SS type A sorting domain-containing protein [Chryseosolibacter sp.]